MRIRFRLATLAGLIAALTVDAGILTPAEAVMTAADRAKGACPSIQCRLDDSVPFSGGARWLRPGEISDPVDDPHADTAGCTTGWGFHDMNSRHVYMLTAYHCLTDDKGKPITGMAHTYQGRDLGRLRPFGFPWLSRADIGVIEADAGDQIFDGPYNTSIKKQVGGMAPTSIGDWVCVSGSFSQTYCDDKVVEARGNGVFVTACQHRPSCSAGDFHMSGSPVWSIGPGGKAIARGIVHSNVDKIPCKGHVDGRDRNLWCTSGIEFYDLATAVGYENEGRTDNPLFINK